jgi:Fur family peroxide stress response transcriptional regulator
MDEKAADVGLLQSRYRLTRQRAAVLRALGDGDHLSAEAILARVRADMPAVSLGTVYRTLEILRGLGLVQSFAYGSDAARYEAALDKHHHLLCTTCHAVANVKSEEVATIVAEVARTRHYDHVDFALTIVGRCPDCAATATPV